jgi:AraC-like DNA-binding protein
MTARDNRVTRRANTGRLTPPHGDPHDVREARGMLRTLEHLGYDLDALLAGADLRRAHVEDPDAYISPRACAAVFARACHERRVPNLALQLAIHTPIGANPLLDYLILSAQTVGHGLERLARYLRLVNPGIRLSLSDTANPVRVVVERAPGPFETELTVSLSVLRFAAEADGRMRAAYVSFRHEPDDAAEYARVLNCPVRTRASWSGWALARDTLRIPLRRRDAMLGRWLERQAVALAARRPADGDVRDEVRSVLSTQATTGDMRIDAVARILAVSPRTLQRRLAKVGTSFDTLRDDARQQAAEAYLSNATLSITEVAYLLGYSEPTAFHRAFRRWHRGVTPQAFRARTLASAETDAAVKVVAGSERARRLVSGPPNMLAGRN